MDNIINYIQNKYIKKNNFIEFNTGDTISVNYIISEGDKIRTQIFKGVVIKKQGKGLTKTFTIRKISHDIGVERIFMLNQPTIKNIFLEKRGKVRKSKIYYFRNLKGKKARIKEKSLNNNKIVSGKI